LSEIQVSLPQPHAGQRRILATAHKHKMLRCGRRFGKTKLGIYEGIRTAVNGGMVGWFSPTNKYALEAWREIVSRLRPVAELDGGRVSEQEKRIELPNGGLVEVWSLDGNDDPARGRSYDLVIIDEAGLINKLATLWEASIEPTLIDRDGGSLFLGTPKGARTPFNVMFAEAESAADADWGAFHGATGDNDTIPRVKEKVERARKRAERRGTLALWAQEYLGIPADDGSNPIGLDAIRAAVAQASPAPVVCWGVDLARAVDYTVAIGLDALGRWSEMHRFREDWGATKARLRDLCGTELPIVMDATGVGSPITQDLQAVGMQIDPFVFSIKSRGVLIEELITAIHSKQITVPDGLCRAELESLGVETNQKSGFTRYSVPDGMTDDCIMSLAMAWRCYQHHAMTPDWPVSYEANLWSPDVDASIYFENDELEFSSIGAGW
jgi:hypothetical protein